MTNNEEENKENKRKNSGRKEEPDKKTLVRLYVRESKIESYGGMDKIKEHLYESIK